MHCRRNIIIGYDGNLCQCFKVALFFQIIHFCLVSKPGFIWLCKEKLTHHKISNMLTLKYHRRYCVIHAVWALRANNTLVILTMLMQIFGILLPITDTSFMHMRVNQMILAADIAAPKINLFIAVFIGYSNI